MPSNVGSLQLTGNCVVSTASSSLVTNLSAYTISWFARYNSILLDEANYLAGIGADQTWTIDNAANITYFIWGTTSDPGYYGQGLTYSPGVVYHICETWTASGNCHIYVNGVLEQTLASAANAWTSNQYDCDRIFGTNRQSPDFKPCDLAELRRDSPRCDQSA